jgi:AcrR family transcriptional regulator
MEPVTTEQPGRWTRRKSERPGEILDAALRVFSEKGFAAARMEDIAKAAGVTKGTIYLYFENKESVFKNLILDLVGDMLGAVEMQMIAYRGPVRDLLTFVLKNVALVLVQSDRVALPKIIIAEAGNFPELAEFYKREAIDRGMGMLGSLMQRGIDRGEFRALPTDHMVRLLIAPMLLSAVWRSTFAQFDAEPFDYQAFIDTHLDVFLRGVSP